MSTSEFKNHEGITKVEAIPHGTHNVGGVVSLRNRKTSDNPTAKQQRIDEHVHKDSADTELALDKSDLDYKHQQEFHGLSLLWLAWQATGVIYGDIGALSLIIWALTLIVTVKYVLIVLHFNDEGEGGTFALYSLLARYANIAERQANEQLVRMERHNTNDLRPMNHNVRNWLENSKIAKLLLKVLAVFGVSLVMADGLLTPAQSVLGAIQGVQVINPAIQGGTVVGISCGILILLYLIQPFGTTKLATGFAPIVVVWLLFNAITGIYNLVLYDHSVLKAFSPYFAGEFLVRNGTSGWQMLGGILLAFTGCEALFADLGAFSRNAISLSWCCFAYPCLLLAYIGQAAFISVNPAAWTNPFFNCVPPGTLWFSLIIAVLAAIVASQALITSTFQLLSQIMKLSYFPQIKVVHTSKKFHGQIYIPMANWLLMIGTIIVTAVYSNTTNLGNAYGVCVILVTFITTCMVSLTAIVVARVSPLIVVPLFIVFAALDGAFLSSALNKVPNGAWFTLLLAVILSSVFVLWRFGKETQWAAEAGDRVHSTELISTSSKDKTMSLTAQFGQQTLTPISGFAIFFDKIGDPRSIPHIFTQYVTKFVSIPEVNVLLHLRAVPRPSVESEHRYRFASTGLPNTYHLTIRYGYMDEVITNDLGSLIAAALKEHLTRRGPFAEKSAMQDRVADDSGSGTSEVPAGLGEDRAQVGLAALELVDKAYNNQVLYILGKEQMRINKTRTNFFRAMSLEIFLWLRENTRSKMAALKLGGDGLVELGFVKNI